MLEAWHLSLVPKLSCVNGPESGNETVYLTVVLLSAGSLPELSIAVYVCVVSVPDPKPTPARIAFSITRVILEAIYAPDEVWGRD